MGGEVADPRKDLQLWAQVLVNGRRERSEGQELVVLAGDHAPRGATPTANDTFR